MKYFYIRNNKWPAAIAYDYDPEVRTLTFGAAFCNPKDQFNKKTGRRVAQGRFEKHPYDIHLSTEDEETDKALRTIIVETLIYYPKCPGRAFYSVPNAA